MRFVLDSGVVLRCFFRADDGPASSRNAIRRLEHSIRQYPLPKPPFVQPVHFMAEVGGVLARLKTPAVAKPERVLH